MAIIRVRHKDSGVESNVIKIEKDVDEAVKFFGNCFINREVDNLGVLKVVFSSVPRGGTHSAKILTAKTSSYVLRTTAGYTILTEKSFRDSYAEVLPLKLIDFIIEKVDSEVSRLTCTFDNGEKHQLDFEPCAGVDVTADKEEEEETKQSVNQESSDNKLEAMNSLLTQLNAELDFVSTSLEEKKKSLDGAQSEIADLSQLLMERDKEIAYLKSPESVQVAPIKPVQIQLSDIVYKQPDYYLTESGIDIIAICELLKLNFSEGNVFKYVYRAGKKEGNSELKELGKARNYMSRLISNAEKRAGKTIEEALADETEKRTEKE